MTSQRLLVAAIALPVLYLLIRFLPLSGFFALIAACVALGQYEVYRMCSMVRPVRLAAGVAFGLLIVWGCYAAAGGLPGESVAMGAVLAAAVMGLLLVELWLGRELTSSFRDASLLLFGALYVGWLLGHLVLLRGLPRGVDAVLFIVLVTWVVDSAAYFIGLRFGSHPLAPVISPKKTVEGALGGLAGGVLAVVLADWWFFPLFGALESVALGLLLAGMGQLGDLAESMLKRGAGVKDSGAWFPSHGGLLDKIDSLVFTAPTFYYYIVWFKGYDSLLFQFGG